MLPGVCEKDLKLDYSSHNCSFLKSPISKSDGFFNGDKKGNYIPGFKHDK